VSTQPLVLVADDEPRITKLVSIALSEEGFRVVTAGGGEEALSKAEEVRPDIVLLDIVSSCPTSTASRSCASCASVDRFRSSC
jgi:CheY-like chemotaxis protein